ncbi:DUF814 domain-containing protein [Candidatus Woesearchaeota archaeon]|nr:DUF814 domain-containing protein [Candidatus Woesearchaeota archaeon]
MRITLDYTKSLEENASDYFERAKTARQKAQGAKEALEETRKKLAKLEKEQEKYQVEEEKKKKASERKKEWFEKFRWFYTSEGFLVIAGRDATTNEIIIKKHTDKSDLVFHSELPGSPFAVIKTEGKTPGKISIDETAQFVGVYSKAWKSGRTVADIFYVNPDQVSKEAPSGEFIGRGSFMIYGKKNLLTVELRLFLGKMEDNKIMAGPESAVKKHCKKAIQLIQGKEKTSAIAKKVRAFLEADDLDDIVKVIPVGSKLKE